MAWHGRRYGYNDFAPYVPVEKRRANAGRHAEKKAKKENREVAPVRLTGKKIANTFWGQAWCDNLERYSDYANRLPRGRTYVRNGSVVDLHIERGKVRAIVAGSNVYEVAITIRTLETSAWSKIKQDCSNSIGSLMDLLRGKFDQDVMRRLTDRETGLFPRPKEIQMTCSCPDWAGVCKHVAAVMYGVGARLDAAPELLFVLRDVDHLELISQAMSSEVLDKSLAGADTAGLSGSDLGELFGIELETSAAPAQPDTVAPRQRGTRKKIKKPAAVKPGKTAIVPAAAPSKSPKTSRLKPVASKTRRSSKSAAKTAKAVKQVPKRVAVTAPRKTSKRK